MKPAIFLSLIVLLLTGCKKIQHEEEISIGKIESYDELVLAIEGVYGKLAKAQNTENDKHGFYAAGLKGDDLNVGSPYYEEYYHGVSPSHCNGLFEGSISSIYILDAWQSMYTVITSANNIIVQYNPVTDLDEETRQILGEAFLLRAYCYFRLTRTFGEIPLIDDIEISYSIKKSTYPEIYEFIENDLKMAMDLLPVNNNLARIPYVTPHRGVAKAMLAEVYLTHAGYPLKDASKYTLAAKEAGETIDSAGFFGFGLMDDFAYLWDREHNYNNESVLTLYYANPTYSTKLDEINFVYAGFSGLSGFKTGPDSPEIMLFFYSTEINFYNNYPAGYRKEITFFSTIYVPYTPSDHPVDTGYIHIDSVDICSRIGYRKFYYNSSVVPYNQYNERSAWFDYYFGSSKVYLFRYAYTLLTYAEASARSGQLTEKAYECVNQIRRRAHNVNLNIPSVYDMQTGLSPEVFADSVVWERAWEFCGEPEGRWFDLVRLEKVEDLPQLRHPDEGGPPEYPVTKGDYFFSIPQADQFLNPNLGE